MAIKKTEKEGLKWTDTKWRHDLVLRRGKDKIRG
jgi:hypothetical protein